MYICIIKWSGVSSLSHHHHKKDLEMGSWKVSSDGRDCRTTWKGSQVLHYTYIYVCCLGLQSTNPSFSRLYMCVHIPCILDHEAMPQAWPCKPILTVNFHGLETGHPTACDKPVRSCHMRHCRNLRCLAMQQVLDTPFIITSRWHFQDSSVEAKPLVFRSIFITTPIGFCG